MKAIISSITLAVLASGCLLAGTAAPSSTSRSSAPGLLVQEYPRHGSQMNNQHQFQVSLDQLGPPIGQPHIAESVHPWKWTTSRNAVASGFLEIQKDGDYAFSTRSFYDRDILLINDKIVCGFRDGDSNVNSLPLKKGRVKFVSIGVVESRGQDSGIHILWKPPGQLELSPIPPDLLTHEVTEVPPIAIKPAPRLWWSGLGPVPSYLFWDNQPSSTPPATTLTHTETEDSRSKPAPRLRAMELITVTNDYIVEAYRNGVKIHDSRRTLLHEHFGATVERIAVDMRPGDWLVFQVVHNRLRWGGSRYFAVAGILGPNQYGFVSDPFSTEWSTCDDPARSKDFITQRDSGIGQRANAIAKPWADGDAFMHQFAGSAFPGKPLWGAGSSTWIKYVAASASPQPTIVAALNQGKSKPVEEGLKLHQPPPVPAKPAVATLGSPLIRRPVQILSATYGTGGKNADVTAAVKEHVEVHQRDFTVGPPDLGIDPNPYWNKGLHIVYMKDGVRREQHRNENEHILPHSFYGPQDKAELHSWILASRWRSEKGEVQFNADGSLTGPGLETPALWETLANNKLRIAWSAEEKREYVFNHSWSAFSATEDAREVFRPMW
ncbi:hypothetical protein EI77_02084 [Prosthecobacter fusiformis]|uniref:PA14 domain-containing protein n=1 Tax=Prosthecobacter fusiformis TaxID=48464 RepID=A0A4R7S0J4_9BACT|nr:hypothetical protein [Prosthecobacter fusiformis]TDU70966.1 hypothetical protein EI77_02084 [Prosthecobacter fusiformis]